MADDASHVSKTVDDMRARVAATLESARTQLAALNGMEAMYGLPLTQLQDIVPAATGAASSQLVSSAQAPQTNAVQRRGGPQTLRPDEYLGEEPMEAAKKYMRSVGHATPFDEIADAVQRGSAAIQGTDWRDRLELSLKRSPYQVITVADHTYGLAEFYTEEQLKRLRSSRRASESRPAPKKKPKPKPKRSEPKKPEPKSRAKAKQGEAQTKTETASE